jgi:hypothetical protein
MYQVNKLYMLIVLLKIHSQEGMELVLVLVLVQGLELELVEELVQVFQ